MQQMPHRLPLLCIGRIGVRLKQPDRVRPEPRIRRADESLLQVVELLARSGTAPPAACRASRDVRDRRASVPWTWPERQGCCQGTADVAA
jgi:hypothetical protein